MSSTIFDQVRKLGNDILEGEEGQKLYAAQKAYENDPQAKALVEEYTKMKMPLPQKNFCRQKATLPPLLTLFLIF